MSKLTVTSRLSTADVGPEHLVVEGENLAVLPELADEFRAAVDLVLIDPPYDSRGRRRQFRDRFEDWPTDVRIRLDACTELLAELGVVAVFVGDDQMPRLRLVMDEVLGKENFLATVVWQGALAQDARFTGGGVDYLVVYARDRQALVDAGVKWTEPKPGVEQVLAAGRDAWVAGGEDPETATALLRRWWRGREHDFAPGLHEYSRLDENGRVFRVGYLGSGGGRSGASFELRHPVSGEPVTSPRGGWVCSEQTARRWVAEGRILFSADPAKAPRRKLFLDELPGQVPAPTFSSPRSAGTKRLTRLLGEHRFDHPKDPAVLARWIKILARPDAAVLDFYAGSGTTAEAVIVLNAADGGSRRAVLVTNNEVTPTTQRRMLRDGATSEDLDRRGVFRHVTEPRLRSAVTGLRPDGVRHGEPHPARITFLRHEN